MADKTLWVPTFVPPQFKIANAAGSDGAKHVLSRIRLVEDTSGDTPRFMATVTIVVAGSFYEAFELENYPFDSQPVGVHLVSAKPIAREAVKFTAKHKVRHPPSSKLESWQQRGLGS